MRPTIRDADLQRLRKFLAEVSGTILSDDSALTVTARLSRRLRALNMNNFRVYLDFALTDAVERDHILDLLTTHETYFFREDHHLELLATEAKKQPGDFRIWSAACSTGQEVYSIAMVLQETLGSAAGWSILGSDISKRVLRDAKEAKYPMTRLHALPKGHLRKYCLRGQGESEGMLMVKDILKRRTAFRQINLANSLPEIGLFNVIFMRNVLIYFARKEQERVLDRVSRCLKPNGILLLGKAEVVPDTMNVPLKNEGRACWRRSEICVS